ncbi:hypothetical protein T11_18124, partial [Trichinella zimbabwensis]
MDRKTAFEEKLCALIKEKGQNAAIFPTTQRDQMITDILRIQSDGPKSYGVLKISEENQLIRLGKNDAIRCIASIEEMFD